MSSHIKSWAPTKYMRTLTSHRENEVPPILWHYKRASCYLRQKVNFSLDQVTFQGVFSCYQQNQLPNCTSDKRWPQLPSQKRSPWHLLFPFPFHLSFLRGIQISFSFSSCFLRLCYSSFSSQQNSLETQGVPMYSLLPHSATSPSISVCDNWWTYTDTLLSPRG